MVDADKSICYIVNRRWMQMKRLLILVFTLFYALSLTAYASTDDTGFEHDLVKNEGMMVKSLDHFVRFFWPDWPVKCDRLDVGENWYCYQYRHYGLKWANNGGKDTDKLQVWESAKTYVTALWATGYFDIIKTDIKDNEAFYILKYIGPGEVNETFRVRKNDPKGNIVVASYLGHVQIYYCTDIVTADLQETAKRLDVDFSSTDDPDDPWEHDCIVCGFDGKCNNCNGTGKVRKLVPGTRDYLWQTCTSVNCQNGKCTVCDGDGMK